MILILSSKIDFSTNQVQDWLLYFKQPNIRISADNKILKFKTILSNKKSKIEIDLGDIKLDLDKIKSFWFRRDYLSFNQLSIYSENNLLSSPIIENLSSERSEILKYLQENLTHINHISDERLGNVNKIYVLQKAVKHGLKIPDSLICSTKDDLISFSKCHPNIISKPIGEAVLLDTNNWFISTYTEIITENDIIEASETFHPTLFQELLDKKYELRIFFINDTYYSMAIFSQNDEKTKIDFRKYNEENPNRNIPFKLPFEIESKLNNLMKEIGLNSGSIDMVVTKNNDYVFLEVNPVGQFGMVSLPCNYYLEKILAENLIGNE